MWLYQIKTLKLKLKLDSGEEWMTFGYQLARCDKEFEVTGDEVRVVEEQNSTLAAQQPAPDPAKNSTDRQRLTNMSEADIDGLAANHHSANTVTQTKSRVGNGRPMHGGHVALAVTRKHRSHDVKIDVNGEEW